MPSVQRDRFNRPGEQARLGMEISHSDDPLMRQAQGMFILHMEDARTGEVLEHWERKQVITLDAGILAAILFNLPTSRNGANMLAIGTGATGSLLSPDAPNPEQRKLNAELERKPWSGYVYRDANGNAVAIPTNVIDWTVTYDEAEAVGPLNEMGILSTISDNVSVKNENPDTYPIRDVTVDLTEYDILVNYLSFSVISKPSTARLTITWRITF